jgi:hypothetical protein
MNLKRNDKIILIVGVVILIIAGAGIALYNTPSDNVDIEDKDTNEMYYEYTWEPESGSEAVESPMVEDGTPFEESYNIKSPSGSVLTQLVVNIEWEDDNTFGIFRTKGKDILTAEVTVDGRKLDATSELNGNDNFSFNINTMPKEGEINASSSSYAATKLNEKFNGKNEADFDISLDLEVGEPWWRLLFNKDTGNTVDISVKYTYYYYDLSEVDNGDDWKTSGNDDDITVSSHAIGEFYVNLGYGRGMI